MPTTPTTVDEEKCSKLKKSIIFGVIAAACIIGWHIYENLFHEKESGETPMEYEIHHLTQELFDAEIKNNPYLAKVNVQGKTNPSSREDHAPQPLLEVHDDTGDESSLPTVYYLKRLYDNYNLDTHVPEKVTPEKEQEELDFLNAIMKTPIMKRTFKFLQQKNKVSANYNEQLQLLKDIWFMPYSRGGGRIGSSGFEHVFLAEVNNGAILGLHNWIYFHEQEKLGNLDYNGYIKRMDLGYDKHHLLIIRFKFHGKEKRFNTLFVGTSPELEMSLYTVCFLLSVGEPCPVQLGQSKFTIITHSWDWRGKKTLATAYPSMET